MTDAQTAKEAQSFLKEITHSLAVPLTLMSALYTFAIAEIWLLDSLSSRCGIKINTENKTISRTFNNRTFRTKEYKRIVDVSPQEHSYYSDVGNVVVKAETAEGSQFSRKIREQRHYKTVAQQLRAYVE